MTTPDAPTVALWMWLFAEWIGAQFKQINEGIAKLMTDVVVQQEDLDNLAASLEAVKTNLATEIANLPPSLPQGNLDGLNQALSDLQGLQTPSAAPVTPPAAPDASTPPVDAPPTS